jgi:hypothetical protein
LEIQPGFELKTIFEATNVNSIIVGDFEVTRDHFILVGGIGTFLPTALTREIASFEDVLKSLGDHSDESIWEKGEERNSAFVLVLGRDGATFADRIFFDTRFRRIKNLVAEGGDRFIAAGSALGDRGWLIAFSLRNGASLSDNSKSFGR